MNCQIAKITQSLSSLSVDETNNINKIIKIIKIQKWFRGCMFRLKRLPLIMYKIKHFLILQKIQFSNQTEDGRINSCIDENEIIT